MKRILLYLALGLSSHLSLAQLKIDSLVLKNTASSFLLHEEGKCMYMGYSNGEIEKLSLKKKSLVKNKISEYPISSLALSPDKSQLAISGVDGQASLLSTQDLSKTISYTAHSASLNLVKFFSDSLIASGGLDDTLRVWNKKAQTVFTRPQRYASILDICSLDSGKIAVGTDEGYLRIWDKQGEIIEEVSDVHSNWLRTLRFDNSRKWILAVDDDGDLATYSSNGILLGSHRIHNSWVRDMELFTKEHLLLSVSDDSTLVLYDYVVGAELYRQKFPCQLHGIEVGTKFVFLRTNNAVLYKVRRDELFSYTAKAKAS